jgi:putative ABC transport system permease protein
MGDFGYAIRLMRRAPLFTFTVLVTVALAIAANTTIFSVVNAVLIKPVPFTEPDRVFQVAEKNDKLNIPNFGASILNFLSWREQAKSFEDLAAVQGKSYTLTGSGEPEQFTGGRISPALTRVLGLSPIRGRTFRDDEEKPSSAPVAMISEGLWKRRFGGDPSIINRNIILNDTPTTVVGIAPAALNLIAPGDVYTPLLIDPPSEQRLNHVIIVFGRVKPGVSQEQAQAEMSAISANMDRQYPELQGWGITVFNMLDTFVTPELKRGLLLLMVAVVLVLLIACANIANLLLARAASRQTEMAVRTAIGASRGRLMRQMLIESTALSLTGGVLGVIVAQWALGAVNGFLPPNLLPVPAIELDRSVLWFSLGLTVVTGLLFGLVPAWTAAKVDLNEVLKQGARGTTGGLRAQFRNSLAAIEIALATILLIGAGLFLQSLNKLQSVALGFDPHRLITFQIAPPRSRYPTTDKAAILYRSLLDSLHTIPGVRAAAVSSGLPLGQGNYTSNSLITTEPSILSPDAEVPADWRIVSPGYFSAMKVPLLRGRDFTDVDNGDAPRALIVSQATAKKFWGDADPIGKTLRRSGDPKTPFTIVGVVGDVRATALNQEAPAVYYPMAWTVLPLMEVAVRTDMPPDSLLPLIRQKLHELDPELALSKVKSMEDLVSINAAPAKLNTILLGIFAVIAWLIASVGIYGVLAYSVTRRTGEIGVRMALGATRQRILYLVLREGMIVAAIGIALGLAGGLALGRTMSSLVFGVQVKDPGTFAAVSITLGITALAASIIPAFRAARVEPMAALRAD